MSVESGYLILDSNPWDNDAMYFTELNNSLGSFFEIEVKMDLL